MPESKPARRRLVLDLDAAIYDAVERIARRDGQKPARVAEGLIAVGLGNQPVLVLEHAN